MPLAGLSPAAIANIENLVKSKGWVIKKMIGAEALPIERLEDRLCFPWFAIGSSEGEIDAYTHLVTRICETAKAKKRVSPATKPLDPGENEKYKGRCFLLSLGFIGSEYDQARKILLAPLTGNGSHMKGDGRKEITQPEASSPGNGAVKDTVVEVPGELLPESEQKISTG
jgi:hypothetical protein